MSKTRQEIEVDQNYDAFERSLAGLLTDHRDQYALMRDRQIVGFFDTPGDAYDEGRSRFSDEVFSIQQVTDEPVDLGFWSLASN